MLLLTARELGHIIKNFPQNTGPNVDDLRSRIDKMVSKKPCADFIMNLMKGTATTNNPAEFTDALKGFNEITSSSQKGVVYGDTIIKTYGYAAGTVFGSVGTHTAQIELPTPAPFPIGLSRRGAAEYSDDQARIRAQTALHETIHLAGKYGFTDPALAFTAAMRGVARPKFDDVRDASVYWHAALQSACFPTRRD